MSEGISLNEPEIKTKTKKKPPPRTRITKTESISLNAPEIKTKKKPPPRTRITKRVSKIKGTSLNSVPVSKGFLDTIKNYDSETLSKIKNFTRKTATKKVGKFMKTYRDKIRLTFLNTVCTDSNACIAFGKETKLIRDFFEDFDIRLLWEDPKIIGEESMNGKVQLLTFNKDGYVANAIFKTSLSKHSDNLSYEAVVGNFINKQRLRFPCFLETYGLYFNIRTQKTIYNYRKMPINKRAILHGCEYPLSIGIMIEYIKESETLDKVIRRLMSTDKDLNHFDKDFDYFMTTQLLYILYQVYAPLSILSDVFTHYDLHAGNVMLYSIGDRYIRYHYHYPEYIVTFNSPYIVKIIDYGNCFFKDEGGYNPEDVYKDLCERKGHGCRDCGIHRGFKTLHPDTKEYGSAQVRNMSYDLRLLESIRHYNSFNKELNKDLTKLIDSTVYEDFDGTTEITGENSKEICNVNDARRHMEKVMKKMFFKKNNDYDPVQKMGEMHIYSDGRPMEYIASKN